MQQPNYRIYATLLDAFWGYLNSDVIWDKYWGWSENPPHTPEEFHEQQFHELIDRINRKPFEKGIQKILVIQLFITTVHLFSLFLFAVSLPITLKAH